MSEEKASDLDLRKFFLEYQRKGIAQVMAHPDFDISKSNYHLQTEDSKIAGLLLRYFNKLHNLTSDLENIEIFLRRFSNKKFYLENDIDELDYTKYHFEVFVHKIHTILEVKKLLVNDFYNIGLKPKDCNWGNLKNKKGLKDSASAKIIEYYFLTFKHLINLRHLNTHQAIFNDEKITELKADLEIYQGFQKFGVDVGEDFKRMRPKFLLDYQVNKYRKEKQVYVKEGIGIVKNYVEKFETVIVSEFFTKVMEKE